MDEKAPRRFYLDTVLRDDGLDAARGMFWGVIYGTLIWLAVAALVVRLVACE